MDKFAQEFGSLLGSAQMRWISVLSPVLFMSRRKNDLLPILRVHSVEVLGNVMKDANLSSAIATVFPPGQQFSEFLTKHVDDSASQGADKLYQAVFSGALVFGHAILDDVLLQCIRLGAELHPEFYRKQVAQVPLKIGAIESEGFNALCDAAVSRWINQQDKESIPSKFKSLLALSKPRSLHGIVSSFDFSIKKIEEIDQLRHSLVHRSPLREVTFDDLEYFRLATNFAMGLLQIAGARFSVQSVFTALGAPHKLPEDRVINFFEKS